MYTVSVDYWCNVNDEDYNEITETMFLISHKYILFNFETKNLYIT